jgi:hypothetical protein
MDDTVMAWTGLDVQRDMSPPPAPLTFSTFMMPLARVKKWESHSQCTAMPWGTGWKFSLSLHFTSVICNVTALWYVVMLQAYTQLKRTVFIGDMLYKAAYTPTVESSRVQSSQTLESRGVHTKRVESNQVCASPSWVLVLFQQRASKEHYSDGEHACFARDYVEKEVAS